MSDNDITLLRLPAVLERTSLARSSLFQLVREGRFPAPRKLGGTRANVWPSTAISEWIQQQLGKDS